jgi:hypothetical protein
MTSIWLDHLDFILSKLDDTYQFFASNPEADMAAKKDEVQRALDEIGQQLPPVTPKGKTGAQAAPKNFDGKRFLKNILVLWKAGNPFIPGIGGHISTAIEGAIEEIAAGNKSDPGSSATVRTSNSHGEYPG